MVEAAIAENPGARVVAKLHPEVIGGGKRGYLLDIAQRHGLMLIAENVAPWALIDHRPHVYTVSSQFGFEALLGGCATARLPLSPAHLRAASPGASPVWS